jgi:hypothetical protein
LTVGHELRDRARKVRREAVDDQPLPLLEVDFAVPLSFEERCEKVPVLMVPVAAVGHRGA